MQINTKEVLGKVIGGLLIATVTGAITWSYSIGSRTSVIETTVIGHYQDILATQAVQNQQAVRLNGVEKTIIEIFHDMKSIQQEQVNLTKLLVTHMKEIDGTLHNLHTDVTTIKVLQKAVDNSSTSEDK